MDQSMEYSLLENFIQVHVIQYLTSIYLASSKV
jgi:hypothetical protein